MADVATQTSAPVLFRYSSVTPIMSEKQSHSYEPSDPRNRDRSASNVSSSHTASIERRTHDVEPPKSPSLAPHPPYPASDPPITTQPPPAVEEANDVRTEESTHQASTTYQSQNLNQHSRGYDQSGFPLSEPQGLASSSPSSPVLKATYRSTRSLGGSEASSPSRIKVKNLSHIQSFASEELLARPRVPRSGPHDPHRQYEISAMPVADIIEMVAGLLTKITTTNDKQHDHVHRPISHHEDQGNMTAQSQCVLAFHGKNVPSITILSYLSRIHKYCPTTYEVFLSLLVYFDRMTENVNRGFLQSFEDQNARQQTPAEEPRSPVPMDLDTIASPDAGSPLEQNTQHSLTSDQPSKNNAQFFVVDSYNIHRLVIAGVTCASKFFSDVFYTNSRYAKV